MKTLDSVAQWYHMQNIRNAFSAFIGA